MVWGDLEECVQTRVKNRKTLVFKYFVRAERGGSEKAGVIENGHNQALFSRNPSVCLSGYYRVQSWGGMRVNFSGMRYAI